MSVEIINGTSIPNLPWEDRPAGSPDVVWRYSQNPVIQPWKVIYRAAPYLMSQQMPYECAGDVPNVLFPCAALVDADTKRMAIYYSAADTVVGMAFAKVDEMVQFVKDNAV